jgi:hypothetical protein
MTSIVISSGHCKYVRGASGYLDEVDEARRVVNRVADILTASHVSVKTFHDDVSKSQSENLERIVDYHNAQNRDLDVSVHFNAYETTSKPMGTECLYVTQGELADTVATSIARASGLIDRGPKKRTDLYFLNNTDEPAILIETCFVDSSADADIYDLKFDAICAAIASAISGIDEADLPDIPALPPNVPVPPERRTLSQGDSGADVAEVQRILGIPADGQFGAVTESAVKGYQAACGLGVDGVVGPQTWAALDDLDARKLVGSDGLDQDTISAIMDLADESAIARYSWKDRGKAPKGYTAGVACCFGLAVQLLAEGDEGVAAMAQKDRGDPNTDALSWYRSQFQSLGMSNTTSGVDTLRHLFALILGLGMRESSGRYCEGRDQSASNVSADTAEAGLFQTSWNIRSCTSLIPPLLSAYWGNPNGFLEVFCEGVNPKSSDLGNYGSGDGAKYQFLSKYAPAFHCFVTALGMRYLRQHWGPINRNEAELRADADAMLREVQALVERAPAPEPPTPGVATITITVSPPGSAIVKLIGAAEPQA